MDELLLFLGYALKSSATYYSLRSYRSLSSPPARIRSLARYARHLPQAMPDANGGSGGKAPEGPAPPGARQRKWIYGLGAQKAPMPHEF